MLNFSFLACVEVAMLVRLARLARIARLVKLGYFGACTLGQFEGSRGHIRVDIINSIYDAR